MTPMQHVLRSLGLRITQDQESPRFAALISSYIEEVQLVENVAWQVLESRMLELATGAQLDLLGKLVGQERVGDSDDEYRVYIRARIAVNMSDGTADDVMRVAGTLLDGLTWRYWEVYPMTIFVEAFGVEKLQGTIANMIRAARMAGVAFNFQFSDYPEHETFAFALGDEEEADVQRGFGGDDPEIGPGGRLVGVIDGKA